MQEIVRLRNMQDIYGGKRKKKKRKKKWRTRASISISPTRTAGIEIATFLGPTVRANPCRKSRHFVYVGTHYVREKFCAARMHMQLMQYTTNRHKHRFVKY